MSFNELDFSLALWLWTLSMSIEPWFTVFPIQHLPLVLSFKVSICSGSVWNDNNAGIVHLLYQRRSILKKLSKNIYLELWARNHEALKHLDTSTILYSSQFSVPSCNNRFLVLNQDTFGSWLNSGWKGPEDICSLTFCPKQDQVAQLHTA